MKKSTKEVLEKEGIVGFPPLNAKCCLSLFANASTVSSIVIREKWFPVPRKLANSKLDEAPAALETIELGATTLAVGGLSSNTIITFALSKRLL